MHNSMNENHVFTICCTHSLSVLCLYITHSLLVYFKCQNQLSLEECTGCDASNFKQQQFKHTHFDFLEEFSFHAI